MPLEQKIQLPDIYIGEYKKYLDITEDFNRTTSGQATYTNPNTGATYTTSGSVYDGQGEEGLGKLLYEVSPILKDYIFDDLTYEGIRYNFKRLDSSVNQNTLLSYTNGVLTNVKEYWEDGTTVKSDATLNYTDGILTSVVTLQYTDLGVLTNTITETLIYTTGTLTSVERTVA